jgi:hypothetical protein
MEYTLGLVYEFNTKKRAEADLKRGNDTSSKKITVTYRGGLNYSWNRNSVSGSTYSTVFGPAVGFSLNLPIGKGYSLISGLSFERKGYSERLELIVFYADENRFDSLFYRFQGFD